MNNRETMEPATTALTRFDVPSRPARVVFVLGTVGAYVLVFLTLYSRVGRALAALGALPIVAAAWLLGLRAGLVVWLLILPLNTLLFNLVGLTGWDTFIRRGGGPGMVVMLIIVVVAGRLRDLHEQLKREMTKRKRAEETLRKEHDELGIRVKDRTAELEESNNSLRREITERKQAEELARQHHEELAHVIRVSTMGEMATGLAHELNQPMTGISTYAAALLRMLSSEPQSAQTETMADMLRKIEAAAQRSGEIIHRLREFVAKRPPQRSSFSVDDAVAAVMPLIEPEAKQNGIDIRVESIDRLPDVEADQIQIEQVLLNLMRNAVEAMQSGPHSDRTLRVRGILATEHAVRISVCDTGPGVRGEDREHLFDQFFSTKPQGLGMGLSICRSIVESHGGKIWADAKPGGGVVISFTLPINRV